MDFAGIVRTLQCHCLLLMSLKLLPSGSKVMWLMLNFIILYQEFPLYLAFVAGKIHEIGSNGISSLAGHNKRRNNCLNAFISLYGAVPLVSTNIKAVDAREEWFW
ncbi:hypothetical protein B296_00013313 [Ensete ventricosum]|uniref:Glycosyl transferase 64 domain-containing protein n=1 Tax=Ensete ventricosum TaxID=4639 RepID=A0A427B7N9_ENSVE|nr:hypothetical protein B296_00013313 [Ensete ventricosum]